MFFFLNQTLKMWKHLVLISRSGRPFQRRTGRLTTLSTSHHGDMFVEVLMLRVLPFVSILGDTPHKPNVLVNPNQSR